MKTKEGTGLHLLILIKEKTLPEDKEQLVGQYIIRDASTIDVGIQGGVLVGILSLMMAYYCFDVNYPKPLFNCLGIIQEIVFKDPVVNKKQMSNNAKLFLCRLSRKMIEPTV